MGSETNIHLPVDVPDSHVTIAVGILAGYEAKLETLDHHGGVHAVCTAAVLTPTGVNGMSRLVVGSGGETRRGGEAMMHYNARHANAMHLLLAGGCRPFWHDIGRGLVRFFGGGVVFDDCQPEKGRNVYKHRRTCPVDKHGLIPNDGAAWNRFQRALVRLQPVKPEPEPLLGIKPRKPISVTECIATGRHGLRCDGDGYCKGCFTLGGLT